MKNKIFIILFLLIFFLLAFNNVAYADMSNWQKGASMYSNWNGDFASDPFKQSLRDLTSTNANYVALIIPLYQSNLYSTDIHAGGNTPTDDALISAITYAHSLGLHVMLKPHLDSYSGEWRAQINPSDRNGWFANYKNKLIHYAQIAQQYGVEDFSVGTELIDMADPNVNGSNTGNWQNLISAIRQNFSGKLTYSANWGPAGWTDEKNNIQFWSSLDYIGISAYFNLPSDGSVSGLESQWNNINNNDVKPLSQRWGKPVVFTEIGYKSVSGSYNEPWNYFYGGGTDQQAQANAYQALFDFWSKQSYMQGVELWNWSTDPNTGWGDNGYTPQHKLAQTTMTTWFARSGGGGPIGNPNFTTTSSANPNQANAGQSVTFTNNIKNTGSPTGNIIVDIEIYDSSNNKVFQKYYDSQMFAQSETKTYTTSWTPSSSGSYKLKIGIFNYNWSQNYLWVDNALSLGGGTPPPTPGNINIWWPVNGASIGGNNVPFKGMVENLDINSYDMYWQVDGGSLIYMSNNNTDYPHKEFDVDLTNWTWNSDNTYHLNFVAKDKSGNTIGQKPIDVTVWH